jgi:hypothetical protein
MREARVEFICGKNVLASIRGWLTSANVVEKNGRSYLLTEFGKSIRDNDRKVARAGSWWAIHLNICFSPRGEPYRSFFCSLGDRGDWVSIDNDFAKKISSMVIENSGGDVTISSIEGNLDGVKKMFLGDSPLTDLGLIETRKESGRQAFRLANPEVADQALVYALSLARERHFRSAMTVHFSEFVNMAFHHFLGMSVNSLRKRLRELSRKQDWREHIRFLEGKDLDSIEFRSRLNAKLTVLPLLQEAEDTWV